MMRQGDGLRMLEVGIARHGGIRVLFCRIKECRDQGPQQIHDFPAGIHDDHVIVKGNLIIPRAARMQPLPGFSDPLNEQCFHVHMDILGIHCPGNAALACILENAVQTIYDGFCIRFRENSLRAQHGGMGNRAQDILLVHSVSNFNALVKFKYHLIRILTEPAAP